MHCAERLVEGGFHVYAAAIEASDVPGFYAAVIVKHRQGAGHASEEVFRDERLEAGTIWVSPDNALAVALFIGTAVAEEQRERA
ncbi:MAG: hypothetical protein AB3X44_09685 [Leptothrix sp. (in: b-proteobacteria)]